MNKKPLILVTNDDGITSKGIRVLIEEVSKLGEVFVMAPDSPNSGMGHAITVDQTIHIKKSPIFGEIASYECSGTPADCVKLAKHEVLKDREIDLVVSGINHGSNSSINVIYSGTMSAAMEGAIENIPSIGFSLSDYALDANFEASKFYANKIASAVLKNGLPSNTLLNVNIPNLSKSKIKGIKICRQALAKWQEEFSERMDPMHRKYYWLTGKFVNFDTGVDTDEWALANGFVSVVPVQFDFTAHHTLGLLNKIKW